jgi:hypothetical protein
MQERSDWHTIQHHHVLRWWRRQQQKTIVPFAMAMDILLRRESSIVATFESACLNLHQTLVGILHTTYRHVGISRNSTRLAIAANRPKWYRNDTAINSSVTMRLMRCSSVQVISVHCHLHSTHKLIEHIVAERT